MAIAFRAAATAVKNDTGTTIACNVPTGTQDNDGMLLCVTVRASVTVTTHASWTIVGSALSDTSATSCRKYVYSRVASSEPAAYTITLSSAIEATAEMLSYSGTATTGLVDASLGTIDTDAEQLLTADAITTTVANTMIVGFFGVNLDGGTGFSITPPSGMTERTDILSTGARILYSTSADTIQAGIGTTGAKIAALDFDPGASDEACFLVALAPGAVASIFPAVGSVPI